MNCPECGAELTQIDTYFKGRPESRWGTAANGLHYPQTPDYKILGEIYQCPNHEGFEDHGEGLDYLDSVDELEIPPADARCGSGCHNGHFHTRNGELKTGHPC